MSLARRDAWALPVALFVGSFAWSFVFITVPFHIRSISTVDPAATLRWTGALGLACVPLTTGAMPSLQSGHRR